MLENIKAIFFDLDDTLINFGGVTAKAWELTCHNLINEIPETGISPLELSYQIQLRNEKFWSDENKRPKGNTDFKKIREEILTQTFKELHIDNQVALDYLCEHYPVYKEKAIYVFEGVYETLSFFKEKGIPLVLITNGDSQRQRKKIERFDLEKYFDFILIEGEQGFGKPDTRIYQKALDLCQVQKEEACMVGDHYLWEVEAPLQYGLKGIWANYTNQPVPQDRHILPTHIIYQISDLKKL